MYIVECSNIEEDSLAKERNTGGTEVSDLRAVSNQRQPYVIVPVNLLRRFTVLFAGRS